MHSVSKIIKFAAAHILPQHQGKCRRLHGHNYLVKVFVRSPVLDRQGMVEDFGTIKAELERVLGDWDHKFLVADRYFAGDDGRNLRFGDPGELITLPSSMVKVLPVPDTTAEMLANYIGDLLSRGSGPQYYRVEVYETDDSMGAWEGPE